MKDNSWLDTWNNLLLNQVIDFPYPIRVGEIDTKEMMDKKAISLDTLWIINFNKERIGFYKGKPFYPQFIDIITSASKKAKYFNKDFTIYFELPSIKSKALYLCCRSHVHIVMDIGEVVEKGKKFVLILKSMPDNEDRITTVGQKGFIAELRTRSWLVKKILKDKSDWDSREVFNPMEA